MEINYELNPRDLIAFQKHAFKTSPTNKRLRLYMYAAFVAFAAYINLLDLRIPFAARLVWFLISLGVYALVLAFWTCVLNAYVFRKSIPSKPNNGVLGHHKIVLAEKELRETTSVNETSHSWKGVDRVEQNEEYYYIFTTPQAAHIIPKRSFDDPQCAQHFYDTACRYKEAAQEARAASEPARWNVEGELSPVEKMIQS